MKSISLLLVFILLVAFCFAQTQKIVTGTVKDNRNEWVSGATVSLTGSTGEVLTQATSAAGRFRFSIKTGGSYVLKLSAVGYKTLDSLTVQVTDERSEFTVPPIILLPSKSRQLEAVVVTARKPLVEQEVDRTVINVGSMISSATSNTLEVLGKTPGVVFNANGDISLNGRSGITVLIDGRQTYMSGQDLAAYLRSIPGAMLEKIELMDNPPARYDAAGNAIINIKLKRTRTAGITGSLASGYSQGRYAKLNESLNLNYGSKKINVFSNLGYSKDDSYQSSLFDRRFFNSDGKLNSTVDLDNYQRFKGKGLNVNTGLDFMVSPATTFGLQVNFNQNTGRSALDYSSNSFASGKLLDTISSGATEVRDKRINFGTNLNFVHKLNKSGREVSGEANYLRYRVNSTQNLDNFIFLPNNSLYSKNELLYLLPASFNIYTVKSDYVHPLANKAKLEAGFKSSFVRNRNVANYYSILSGNQVIDNRQSNDFEYQENIHAVYLNSQKSWTRFSSQLGLRAEHTSAKGRQMGNDSVPPSGFTRNYLQFFPSVFLMYKLDTVNKNSLTFSLTRRINRPNYQYLNPFVFIRDKYSYTAGNPNLVPQYQYRYELRFIHRQLLRFTLSYNRFTDVILQTIEAVDGVFINRPQNIAKGYMLLFSTGINVNPTKWWTLNSDVHLSNIGLNGTAYNQRLDPSSYIARINVNNQFRFSKSWSGEAGAYYASQDINSNAFTGAMWRSNIGVQKKILKDKASIRFSVDDIFHSWVYNNRSVGLNQAQYFERGESDTQRFGIGFTYRFGREDFARKRRYADNASDEEKSRVQ
jgi:hypothetical protein